METCSNTVVCLLVIALACLFFYFFAPRPKSLYSLFIDTLFFYVFVLLCVSILVNFHRPRDHTLITLALQRN